MTIVNEHAPGTFCWVDLGTTDSEAAKKFYTELFDWKAIDTPAGPGMTYTILQVDGKDAAALYQLTEEHRSQGVPPHWLSYISVASVDESAETAQASGGRVLMTPFDVFDMGRMTLIQDPTGATFALWQPRQHIGAHVVNQPGTFCWNELATTNTHEASKFYTRLFDWEAKEGTGPHPYTEFTNRGRANGGMMEITTEMGNVPPHWLVYFAVEDCDQSADKALRLGAEIRVPPTDIPGTGRFAVIQDSQGAVFATIKLTNPD